MSSSPDQFESDNDYCYNSSLLSNQTLISDDYICSICHGIIKDAVSLICGHTYGNKCINNWIKNKNKCPICRLYINKNEILKCTLLNLKINGLDIKCKYNNNGCNFIGTFNNINNHEVDCDYRKVECNFCKVEIRFIDMFFHNKKIECKSCKTLIPDCINKDNKVKCPNNCDLEICYHNIDEHCEDDCLLQNIACSYEAVGCTYEGIRKECLDHEANIPLHLSMMMRTISAQQAQIKELKAELSKISDDNTESLTKLRCDVTSLETNMEYLRPISKLKYVLQNSFHDFKLEYTSHIINWISEQSKEQPTTFIVKYVASIHTHSKEVFLKRCKGIERIFTVIQNKAGNLFGGFSTKPFSDHYNYHNVMFNRCDFVRDPTAFVFTLQNPHNIPPTMFKVENVNKALRNGDGVDGPCYGNGDLTIPFNDQIYTWFPQSFEDSTNKGVTLFSGSKFFGEISDIVAIACPIQN